MRIPHVKLQSMLKSLPHQRNCGWNLIEQQSHDTHYTTCETCFEKPFTSKGIGIKKDSKNIKRSKSLTSLINNLK